MKTTKLVTGHMDTRSDGEDFALTPYLSSVNAKYNKGIIKGVALTWGYKSIFLALGINIPKNYPTFDNYTKK
jgi:hypothetical protein